MTDNPHDKRHDRCCTEKSKAGLDKRAKRKKISPASLFDIAIAWSTTANVGGKKQKLSAEDAQNHAIYHQAVAGNYTAVRDVVGWIEEREALRPKDRSDFPTFEFEEQSYGDVDEALQLLRIAKRVHELDFEPNRAGLILDPDFVAGGLARNPDHVLSARQWRDLRERTSNPETIEWPEAAGHE